jgi:DNA-binding protein WhiA
MSFSQKVKNELARIDEGNRCCQLAELIGLINLIGKAAAVDDCHFSLTLETENPAIARKAYRLTKNLFDLRKEVSVRRRKRLKKNNIYIVKLLPQKQLSKILEVPKFNQDILKNTCCHRAYLRGAFLGGGSVSNPQQKTYHLEIILKDQDCSKVICELMKKFGLNPKTIIKRHKYMVYLKESEQIVDFLNVVGAHSALLSFEGVRVHKDVRNRINRLVNCETANLSKTVDAALKQVEIIKLIDRNMGLHKLPPALQTVARLRLENPELSLRELGELMSPTITKSGVNHRMRRLQKIAERISRGL